MLLYIKINMIIIKFKFLIPWDKYNNMVAEAERWSELTISNVSRR